MLPRGPRPILDPTHDLHQHPARPLPVPHPASHPLALSNVWDAASAVLTQHAGARAVTTTSAGIAHPPVDTQPDAEHTLKRFI